ncbi:MAG: hypothetical protein WCC48_02035 [Anaeromyxobacteraceae bacterium]
MADQQQAGGTAESRRPAGILRRITSFLTSPELAIGLLVAVLVACVVGVTLVRGARAGELIFGAPWFNGMLVLLAISSATAFFSRTWRRKLTLVSAGMIMFHVSFAATLGGIAFNRLFFFDGLLRLTEGETLPNDRLESYDRVDKGRFFDLSRLRGETTLVKMHVNYRVEGENKRAAYEVAVNDGDAIVRKVIYVTEHLDFEGVRYFCQMEGYSVLLVLGDAKGRELYGAHVPLQSVARPEGGYRYASWKGAEPVPFPFPPSPDHPHVELTMEYRPNTVVERSGDVTFDVRPLGEDATTGELRSGTVPVGGTFDAGPVKLSPREIRYWVGVNVRYDPGLSVVLASLCLGLAGMVLTFVGRVRQGGARRRAT